MFETAPIQFDCPKCSRKIEKTIGWLTLHKDMTCDGCGVTINLNTDDLSGGIKKIEKAIDSIPKSIDIKF
jgi:transcription elongation factor Elf1